MDLGAYIQIEDFDAIAKANGIEVPRLRGYRMMVNEDPVYEEEMLELSKRAEQEAAERFLESEYVYFLGYDWCPFYSSGKRRKNKYLSYMEVEDGKKQFDKIRWELLHGKVRKGMKYTIKDYIKRSRKQFDVWNKYAGKPNILYVHARIGGNNWDYYKNQVIDNPRFLEKVNDWWDSTYCDLYFFVNEI